MSVTSSDKHPQAATYRHQIPAGEPFLLEVKAGQTL
ncbi:MAG TPA: urea carboxylase, partial [Pseudomonas sp.]|nr:urea carboxylase [Pseudomonas sp.]